MGNPGPRGEQQGPNPRQRVQSRAPVPKKGTGRSKHSVYEAVRTRAQWMEIAQKTRYLAGMKVGTGSQQQGCLVAELQMGIYGNLRLFLLRAALASEIGCGPESRNVPSAGRAQHQGLKVHREER